MEALEEREERFLTVKELAEISAVGASYVRRLLAQGVIRARKIGGEGRRGSWLITAAAAKAWLDSRQNSSE